MEWLRFKTKDPKELKKKYKTLKNLKEELKKSLGKESLSLIKLTRWTSAFEGIESLISLLEKEMKKQRYLIALTELDNPDRSKILGINSKVLSSKKESMKWRNKILKVVAPDNNNNFIKNTEATKKLMEIYLELINDE